MNSSGFTVSFEAMNEKLKELIKISLPEDIDIAHKRAASKLISYAIEEEPRAPHKTGDLWRSQLIDFVQHADLMKGTPSEILAGFAICYAARLHEAPDGWNWTLKGSGPKYLESKLIRHYQELLNIIIEVLQARLK